MKPGDIKYKDLNGDGVIDDNDQTYYSGIYPNNPQLVYGFGLNVQYKGIYAGVFFQGVGRTSVNLKANTSYFVPFANGKDQSSARVQAADHWSASDPNNMNVLYPRLHTNEYSNNTLNSTWWYRNGSFLRLKNVELGYQFDKNWCRDGRCRIFAFMCREVILLCGIMLKCGIRKLETVVQDIRLTRLGLLVLM